jgi:hypothetical protein
LKSSIHEYEIRLRKDKRGFDLISDALPFGGLWYTPHLGGYRVCGTQQPARMTVIRVYNETGNLIERLEHAGVFREP